MQISELTQDEAARRHAFPVAAERVYLAHAGVTALPRAAGEALRSFAEAAERDNQEASRAWKSVEDARKAGAQLLGCTASEIALLGPTALGLSLTANGIPWRPGDEVVYHRDDYPANVYPWSQLRDRGVSPVALSPERPGEITWELVARRLTSRTRMVALASCHFLSGFRIDTDEIGRNLHERGVLFCVDGIQTLGAFPMDTTHVDFLSADSHKWMLGPAGAGIFFVKAKHHAFLRPTLLGSWNVYSPDFIAQDGIAYYEGARRYEPGMLNLPGIAAMEASLRLLLDVGIEAVAERILHLRGCLVDALSPLGYRLYGPWDDPAVDPRRHASGIVTVVHPEKNIEKAAAKLAERRITVSLRHNRAGQPLLRLSPHFYNTEAEIERVAALMS